MSHLESPFLEPVIELDKPFQPSTSRVTSFGNRKPMDEMPSEHVPYESVDEKESPLNIQADFGTEDDLDDVGEFRVLDEESAKPESEGQDDVTTTAKMLAKTIIDMIGMIVQEWTTNMSIIDEEEAYLHLLNEEMDKASYDQILQLNKLTKKKLAWKSEYTQLLKGPLSQTLELSGVQNVHPAVGLMLPIGSIGVSIFFAVKETRKSNKRILEAILSKNKPAAETE